MRRIPLPLSLIAGFTLLVLPQAGRAAPKPDKPNKFNKVKFDTFDQVEIHGSFYPSHAGNQAPCVILLHQIGGNREQAGWADLAERLQDNYSVLTFDFRGHGDSTDVGMGFWADRNNVNGVRGANVAKKSISYRDFNLSYYPMLVNDIAAARHFLDQKNDAGQCNSSNIIVIGAQDGAALGAMWIASEWRRRQMPKNPFGVIPPAAGGVNLMGKDVVCAVWLSMNPSIGKMTRAETLANWFTNVAPQIREKVPMYFISGEADDASKRVAQYLVKVLTTGAKGSKVSKLTGTRTIEKTKLTGRELLGKKALGTEEYILKYIDKVMDERAAAGPERDKAGRAPYPVPINLFISQ
jgi:cephalosporin-C deacetylase-like acetyl esterase